MCESFHVFLSHNSQDKPIVRKLARALEVYDLRVWLDEEQLVPGRPWQEALETIIQTTQAAAVLIGESGLGPWEDPEMRACLSQFVNRRLPVIPVLLPGSTPATANLPLFLQSFTWVNLSAGLTNSELEKLVWGITGIKPEKSAMPADWNIPRIQNNDLFIGRDEALNKLKLNFTQYQGKACILVLTGADGIGKSTLSKVYLHQHKDAYTGGIYWFQADSETTLNIEFEYFAKKSNLCTQENPAVTQDIIGLVRQLLEKQIEPCLLIFDNAESFELLSKFLPRKGSHHVLITSHNEIAWDNVNIRQKVPKLSRTDSISFLEQRTTLRDEYQAANDLAEELGDLPLLLETAAASILYSNWSLLGYLEEFRRNHRDMLETERSNNECSDSAAALWEISFKKLAVECPEALALLNFYSFLDASNIPELLLPITSDNQLMYLQILASDSMVFRSTIRAIKGYSLIGSDSRGFYIMHRPIQAAIRDRLADEKTRWAKMAVETINTVFNYDKDDLKTWSHSTMLLPHALRVIYHADRVIYQVDKKLPEGLLIQLSDLRTKVGLYLMDKGQHEDAINHLEQSIVIAEKLCGTGKSSNAIGDILRQHGNLNDALNYAMWAFATDEKTYGPMHPDVARDAISIALILKDKCDLKTAIDYANKALIIDTDSRSLKFPPSIARDNLAMAAILKDKEELDDALNLAKNALDIIKNFSGDMHSAVALIAIKIAEIQLANGVPDDALYYANKALRINEITYGPKPKHPNTATIYTHMAGIHHANGDLPKALEFANDALAIDESIFGKYHPCVARDADIIAGIQMDNGNFDMALKNAKRALDIDEHFYGRENQVVATRAITIAGILHAKGELPGARDSARRALGIDEKAFGLNHPSVARDCDNLASILRDEGGKKNLEDALPLAKRALAIDKIAYGEKHTKDADIAINIAGIFKDKKDMKNAHKYAQQSFDIDTYIYGSDHPRIARDASMLANIEKDMGDYKNAYDHAIKAFHINKAIYGDDNKHVAEAANQLAWILKDDKQFREARDYAELALNINDKVLASEHPNRVRDKDLLNFISQDEDALLEEAGVFRRGVWAFQKLDAVIPEAPFEVLIDGQSIGTTKLLAFARQVPDTDQYPQILVIYSSGYLRLKAGIDPKPPLPFGQSLVLGPALAGISTSFPKSTLFFHPQIQRVAIDTSHINQDGTNSLRIRITSSNSNLSPDSITTNRIMNLDWTLTLHEPNDQATTINVAGTFEFTEEVIPDPVQTAKTESMRLMQISTMFIDNLSHDVDAFRFRDAEGVVTVGYDPGLANLLLPVIPSSLAPDTLVFDSLHSDEIGQPNGNTPSYRITIESTTGPMSGPITVRSFFNNENKTLNDDTLGLWAFQKPSERIERGATGSINYTVTASNGPLPAL